MKPLLIIIGSYYRYMNDLQSFTDMIESEVLFKLVTDCSFSSTRCSHNYCRKGFQFLKGGHILLGVLELLDNSSIILNGIEPVTILCI